MRVCICLGKDVHFVVDIVSSQQPIHRQASLQQLPSACAFLTIAQSAAFINHVSATNGSSVFQSTVSKLTDCGGAHEVAK